VPVITAFSVLLEGKVVPVDVEIHIFLTWALVGGEWSASCPGRFKPGERAPGYPLDRRLSGLKSRSGRRGEVKILTPIGT
jgi:hypothetical protein